MATTDLKRNTRPLPPANFRRTHQGNTFSNLEKMVENCVTTGPLMSVGQIRILLRVEQACENCEATGIVESRGLSPEVSQDRCPECRGKGYVIPERETVAQ